jgi:hypothetical protein
MILSEIEPATFQLVAQCLNQLRHRVPPIIYRVHVVKDQSYVLETECIDGMWIGTGETGGTFPWFQVMCHESGVMGQQSLAQWEREEENICTNNAKRRKHTCIRKNG